MAASIVSVSGDSVTHQVQVKLSGSMPEMEHGILDAVNDVIFKARPKRQAASAIPGCAGWKREPALY